MNQLRTHLNVDVFINLVKQAVKENDYKLLALYDHNHSRCCLWFYANDYIIQWQIHMDL